MSKAAYSFHAEGLAELQAELGDELPTFVWNGNPYPILPGGAKFRRQNDTGGFTLSADLQMTCLTSAFGNVLPDSGDIIAYQGSNYTITSVTIMPAAFQMRINADAAAEKL